MKRKLLLLPLIITFTVALTFSREVRASYEEPKYEILDSHDSIEIRQYKSRIAAEIAVDGEQKIALGEGFNILAAYLFGKNKRKTKMPMTAPAVANNQTTTDESLYRSESIAMTAPVTAFSNRPNKWTIRFYMPSIYSLTTLPTPDNECIKLVEIPPEKVAVLKFSGFSSKASFEKKAGQLQKFLVENKIITTGPEFYAYYNPPWTLPFLRRNEVMISIAH